MKFKIISDGTTAGTKVVDENGETIGLIQHIKWEVGVSDVYASATIQILKIPVELTTENVKITEGFLEVPKAVVTKSASVAFECTDEEFEEACKQIK